MSLSNVLVNNYCMLYEGLCKLAFYRPLTRKFLEHKQKNVLLHSAKFSSLQNPNYMVIFYYNIILFQYIYKNIEYSIESNLPDTAYHTRYKLQNHLQLVN